MTMATLFISDEDKIKELLGKLENFEPHKPEGIQEEWYENSLLPQIIEIPSKHENGQHAQIAVMIWKNYIIIFSQDLEDIRHVHEQLSKLISSDFVQRLSWGLDKTRMDNLVGNLAKEERNEDIGDPELYARIIKAGFYSNEKENKPYIIVEVRGETNNKGFLNNHSLIDFNATEVMALYLLLTNKNRRFFVRVGRDAKLTFSPFTDEVSISLFLRKLDILTADSDKP